MEPIKFGDTFDIAKRSVLGWLDPEWNWLMHPMYFPARNRDEAFPGQFADSLGVRLVQGDIEQRPQLVEVVATNPGHLFLDPDKGLRLDNWRWDPVEGLQLDNLRRDLAESRPFVNIDEFIEIARSPARERKLVLVYDQSINRDYRKAGTPRQQLMRKLWRLRGVGIHAVAYVSHIAFIWASTNPEIVCAATRQLLLASHLPDCCFVDDGCAHVPH